MSGSSSVYRSLDPAECAVGHFFAYLVQAVVPRPVALVSSMDAKARVNLSPFSFFNAFGARPPILVFSPSRSVRDNSTKHTLDNVQEHPEAVVHIVNYAMVQQTSLASTAYAKGVNEFIKAGFRALPSKRVQPPRVAEAPIAFECKVQQVISLGQEGGAGNLVVCQVLLMHIQKAILDEKERISPLLLDPIARLGENYYCRINKETLFSVKKPLDSLGIGVDALPEALRLSPVLTGNDLGKLGNVEKLPSTEEIKAFATTAAGRSLHSQLQNAASPQEAQHIQHKSAQKALHSEDLQSAWRILLQKIPTQKTCIKK